MADDLPLFHAIVSDLFPGISVPVTELGELQGAVSEQLTKAGLQYVEGFNTKIMQLFETFNVRFGVVIVGPTGAGKTTCYRTLANSMTALHERGSKNESFNVVRMHVLNPKCISMGELYGEFNDITQVRERGRCERVGVPCLPPTMLAPLISSPRRSGRTASHPPSSAPSPTMRRRSASGRCLTAPSTRCGSRT